MDEIITKRIHISGLTPAITAKDLSDRLASFGTVKAFDGFGALDALGQPRKFAYATLETTKGKLARCMNLLSGVTWKGAKLRLGEAKLDFRERILHDKRAAEDTDGEPPKKRRRLPGVQGVHSRDMSVVTPENVATRGGWRVTQTGRLIRPMRMRPSHPLPELILSAPPPAKSKEKGKGKSDKEKSRKRVRDPPTRARRRTIDPTKYGSQHLKGIFLENAAAFTPPAPSRSADVTEARTVPVDRRAPSSRLGSEDEKEEDSSSDDSEDVPRSSVTTPSQPKSTFVVSKRIVESSTTGQDLAEEKKQSLGLLQSLFGGTDEWGGVESVGSDVDVEDERPSIKPPPSQPSSDAEEDLGRSLALEVDEPLMEEATHTASTVPECEQTGGAQKTKLKDLFAPREEEAGFSLLGHLDLDLELEEDVPLDVSAPVPSTAPSEPAPAQLSTTHAPHITTLDASRPFFFPTERGGGKGNAHDPTNWRSWFYRTDTPEAIRERWEHAKGELTAGWKRRHREAVKSRRRRGGGGDAD